MFPDVLKRNDSNDSKKKDTTLIDPGTDLSPAGNVQNSYKLSAGNLIFFKYLQNVTSEYDQVTPEEYGSKNKH